MIKYTVHKKTGKEDVLVFENEQEFIASELCITSLEDCKAGSYVKSDNGYYVPVLYRKNFKKSLKGKNTSFVKISFPAGYVYNNILYLDNNKFRRKIFKWSRDTKANTPKKYISARDKLFLFYLSEGMDLYDAFNATHTKYKSSSKIESLLGYILDNPNFIEYMRKENIVGTLKKSFESTGNGPDEVAKRLSKIIDNKNYPASMRQYALETMVRLTESNVNVSSSKVDQERVNKEIEEKIIKNQNVS